MKLTLTKHQISVHVESESSRKNKDWLKIKKVIANKRRH